MHLLHYRIAVVRMLVSFFLKIFLPCAYIGLVYTTNKHKRKHNCDVYTYRLAQDKHRIRVNSRKGKCRFLVLFLHLCLHHVNISRSVQSFEKLKTKNLFCFPFDLGV